MSVDDGVVPEHLRLPRGRIVVLAAGADANPALPEVLAEDPSVASKVQDAQNLRRFRVRLWGLEREAQYGNLLIASSLGV